MIMTIVVATLIMDIEEVVAQMVQQEIEQIELILA
jgi:hypothetical protein